jgi:hypothetical protein
MIFITGSGRKGTGAGKNKSSAKHSQQGNAPSATICARALQANAFRNGMPLSRSEMAIKYSGKSRKYELYRKYELHVDRPRSF